MRKDPILSTGSLSIADQEAWTAFGFKFGEKGAHTSRTIMFEELSVLLQHCSAKATREDYGSAITEENCLGKRTLSTRQLTMQRLSELYALDPAVPLFRCLRVFWDADEKAHAQLAILTALARDPLLRATAPIVLATPEGENLARQRFTEALRQAVEGRLNDSILDKVVRNTGSSWTQSGHFVGRSHKVRKQVFPTPASTAYSMLLGYMLGARGLGLFETLFARVLDRDANELTYLAMDAKRLGLLDIKTGGGLMIVSFDAILTEQEKRLIHGSY